MKLIAPVILFAATAALAQEAPSDAPPLPKIDYRPDTLIRLLQTEPKPLPREKRVRWGWGTVEFRVLNTRVRIGIVDAFPGSVPRTTSEFIDPFRLTHTEYATTPRSFATRRAYGRERARIERMEKERAKIVVKTE
jgi:hypothetical protein